MNSGSRRGLRPFFALYGVPYFQGGTLPRQREYTQQLINLSVPRPELGYLRRIESKKPVGESFLWSVMAASPMYDPPYQSRRTARRGRVETRADHGATKSFRCTHWHP